MNIAKLPVSTRAASAATQLPSGKRVPGAKATAEGCCPTAIFPHPEEAAAGGGPAAPRVLIGGSGGAARSDGQGWASEGVRGEGSVSIATRHRTARLVGSAFPHLRSARAEAAAPPRRRDGG